MILRDDPLLRAPARAGRSVDVFVSYKQGDDSPIAEELVRRLRAAGFSVFSDQDIRAGEVISDRIDAAIRDAAVVLVLWSASVDRSREYVLGEAMAAKDAGTLLPVALDETPVTVSFRAFLVPRLARDGVIDEQAFRMLRRDIGARCGHLPTAALAPEPTRGSSFAPLDPITRRTVRATAPRPAATPSPLARTTTGAAVLRAAAAIEMTGIWPVDVAPPTVLSRVRDLGADPAAAIAVADLGLQGVTRTVLLLEADRFRYGTRTKETSVTYTDLVRHPVRLTNSGYGFTATIAVEGVASLEVRGRQQTTLLLEILHALREELSWVT
jgi:hypothetical protein